MKIFVGVQFFANVKFSSKVRPFLIGQKTTNSGLCLVRNNVTILQFVT